MKKHKFTPGLILMLLAGLGLLLYPSFSDYWNSIHQSRAIASYADAVADIADIRYDEILAQAHTYNQALYSSGIQWYMSSEDMARYNETLNISGSGIMSYIEIPAIDVSLPVFHGTSESVLQTAIGHLPGTSLPVGGKNTHAVLSGHRGLPSARLFTHLDQLKIGDIFLIHVLNETLTYEVDQILTVDPSDVAALGIEEGEDLVTLVTCTPYGINTHRLLVRGHRIENWESVKPIDNTSDSIEIDLRLITSIIAGLILLLLLLVLLFFSKRRKKRSDQ